MRNTVRFGMFGMILLVVGLIAGATYINHNTVETITIKVDSKERITTGYGDNMESKYMIYCESEVFENTDDITFGKMHSHDIYRILKAGNTYKVKVCGFRNEHLSTTRNILEIIE